MKFPGWPAIAEGIRIGAPIPLTLGAAGLVGILWRGGWPIETAEQRVQFLGIGLLVLLLLLGLALFLAKDGIKSISLRGPGGVELNVNEDGKDEQS
jgi:hypothetical protein